MAPISGRLISSHGRLEPARAAKIVDQIADALDNAHEQCLVHRDVKPANVLVESRRRGEHAYLADLGSPSA
jgi:serine/threonine-protein kinase